MRILCVDPGEKRIGIAISDATGSFARPLTLIRHTSRSVDAASIVALAVDNRAEMILVGQSLDIDGKPNLSGRRAARLAGAIRTQTDIPVQFWDESDSTQAAKRIPEERGVKRKRSNEPLDDYAAAIILQSYLDAHENPT
ncbi:MAG: Holliday junction resolvase RuvX [Anaerolineales bacterium]|jgi:putative Holliday junction resolvase